MTGVPQQIGDTVPRRAVLPTVSEANHVWSVSVSPSGKLKVLGKQTVMQGGYPGPGGTCISAFQVSAPAYPIVLSAPNPLTNPLLGDGTNQFVYSADTPDGYLYVPGAIQVSGGSAADSQWLINNNPIVTGSDMVDVRIEGSGTTSTTIPNVFTHQWSVSNGIIYVNTPQNTSNPYPGYQFNNWIFKGLPSSFSTVADGNHQVNLYVQGTKSQAANIQTFYNGTASNYPQAEIDNSNYGY